MSENELLNLLCQGLRKLSSDRQTDSTKIIYHGALWVVRNNWATAEDRQ